MRLFRKRVSKGIPTGGQFAASTHPESEVDLRPVNQFAQIERQHELDKVYEAAKSSEGNQSPDALSEIERDYADRTSRIFEKDGEARWRTRRIEDYAEDQEKVIREAQGEIAGSKMRSISWDIQEKNPEAASVVLEMDTDGGTDYARVSEVLDEQGEPLGDDAVDDAQEAVTEHGSAYLRRYSGRPVDLRAAVTWEPGQPVPEDPPVLSPGRPEPVRISERDRQLMSGETFR